MRVRSGDPNDKNDKNNYNCKLSLLDYSKEFMLLCTIAEANTIVMPENIKRKKLNECNDNEDDYFNIDKEYEIEILVPQK